MHKTEPGRGGGEGRRGEEWRGEERGGERRGEISNYMMNSRVTGLRSIHRRVPCEAACAGLAANCELEDSEKEQIQALT